MKKSDIPAAEFKRCSNCNFQWRTREQFLNDPGVQLVGYQVHFRELEAGLFLFNHSCRSTISVRAGLFSDLYDGPIFQQRATGTEDCASYCLNRASLGRCPASCECAYVREVLAIVREWAKTPAGVNTPGPAASPSLGSPEGQRAATASTSTRAPRGRAAT